MFSNYTELQAEIARWLDRTDLAGDIPSFIRLAEVAMCSDLNIQALETTANINITAGVESYSLPTNMISFIKLEDEEGKEIKTVNPDAEYTEITKAWIESDTLHISPTPIEAKQYKLYYKQQGLKLDEQSTNAVLVKYPNIYLYGSLLQSAPFINDEKKIQVWGRLYLEGVARANKDNNYKRKATLTSDLLKNGLGYSTWVNR